MSQTKPNKLKPRKNESGAVLLMTLLVMSLMAVLSVSLMDDVRYALRRAVNIQHYAQADWYLSGAEDFTQSHLETLLSGAEGAAVNAALRQAQPVVFPLDGGGTITVELSNSQCVSLGGLADHNGRKLFRQLLETVGWPTLAAANFTSVAADWTDGDSQLLPGGAEDGSYLGKTPAYRTPNAVMASVSELRALRGITEDNFQKIRPFVCARNSAASTLNINTIEPYQAPLLAAFLGGRPYLETARRLIDQRPASGYSSKNMLQAAPALALDEAANAALENIVFTPDFIWAQIRVDLQNISRHAIIEFEIKGTTALPGFKRLGQEENRPRPKVNKDIL